MQIRNQVRNQNGAMAVMLVAIVSIVIVTTLSTVYMYLVNRTKYQAKIRQAYIMTQVMEDFGRMLRLARDTAIAGGMTNPGPGVCPGGVQPITTAGVPVCFNSCPSPLPTGSVCELGGVSNVGFPCLQHLGKWYCLEGSLSIASTDGNFDFEKFAIKEDKTESTNEKQGWVELIASHLALPEALATMIASQGYGSNGDIAELCRYSPYLPFCDHLRGHRHDGTDEGKDDSDQDDPNHGWASGGNHDPSTLSPPTTSYPVLTPPSQGGGQVVGGQGNPGGVGQVPPELYPPSTPGGSGTPGPGVSSSFPYSPTTGSSFLLEVPNCAVASTHPNCQSCGTRCAKITYCFRGHGNCAGGSSTNGTMVQSVKLE